MERGIHCVLSLGNITDGSERYDLRVYQDVLANVLYVVRIREREVEVEAHTQAPGMRYSKATTMHRLEWDEHGPMVLEHAARSLLLSLREEAHG